ncbi:MAG: hypothetical protein Q9207_006720 [Kuettlingeria erythrocarpa]
MPLPATESKNRVVETITEGLRKMCSDTPLLLRRITREADNKAASDLRPGHLKWELPDSPQDLDQPSLPISINDMTSAQNKHAWRYSYEELTKAGMPSSLLEREIFGPPITMEQRPLKIQVNFIPGGCLLFIISSHVFCDAWGFYVMCDRLAQYCRHVDDSAVEPRDDRAFDGGIVAGNPMLSRERSGIDYDRLKRRPELWEMLGLDWRPKERSWGVLLTELKPPKAVRSCTFSLHPEALARLKETATGRTGAQAGNRISTNDAIIALLWRCILKVRVAGGRRMFLDDNQSMHMVAMDARQQLSPPVPPSYPGNVVMYSMARMPIDLITAPETTLATVAGALRKSLNAYRRPDLFRDAMDLAASIPDARQLGLAFPTWLAENLVTSSISGIPFYEIDFGGTFGGSGKPDYFRYPKGGFEGLCFVMPRQRNGVLELFLSMEASQMDDLIRDAEFATYAHFVSE